MIRQECGLIWVALEHCSGLDCNLSQPCIVGLNPIALHSNVRDGNYGALLHHVVLSHVSFVAIGDNCYFAWHRHHCWCCKSNLRVQYCISLDGNHFALQCIGRRSTLPIISWVPRRPLSPWQVFATCSYMRRPCQPCPNSKMPSLFWPFRPSISPFFSPSFNSLSSGRCSPPAPIWDAPTQLWKAFPFLFSFHCDRKQFSLCMTSASLNSKSNQNRAPT